MRRVTFWARVWVRFARALPAPLTEAARRKEERATRKVRDELDAWFRGIREDGRRRREREAVYRENIAVLADRVRRDG